MTNREYREKFHLPMALALAMGLGGAVIAAFFSKDVSVVLTGGLGFFFLYGLERLPQMLGYAPLRGWRQFFYRWLICSVTVLVGVWLLYDQLAEVLCKKEHHHPWYENSLLYVPWMGLVGAVVFQLFDLFDWFFEKAGW